MQGPLGGADLARRAAEAAARRAPRARSWLAVRAPKKFTDSRGGQQHSRNIVRAERRPGAGAGQKKRRDYILRDHEHIVVHPTSF
ncbi:hypothetical protein LJR225_002859 [Phenylobacterium sp. LjRoot225]|uniref:hypothetical protein n=1 Tax=Phenylobacterium sp. LjRoot225 TaxID=3342285 RepID=UPI003ECD68D9